METNYAPSRPLTDRQIRSLYAALGTTEQVTKHVIRIERRRASFDRWLSRSDTIVHNNGAVRTERSHT